MSRYGDSDVITVFIKWHIKPECEEEFLAFTREYARVVEENEPGCTLYSWHRAIEAPFATDPVTESRFFTVIRHVNEEARQRHEDAEYRKEGVERISKWWVRPPEVYYRLKQIIPE